MFNEQSTTKKLLKASKEKGCERISLWIKAIRRHMYWCATSTKEGFGAMILAKWKSLLRHIANKHTDHEDDLFKSCVHGEIDKRKWIKVGMQKYILGIKCICTF
jgi:hypothetical protein